MALSLKFFSEFKKISVLGCGRWGSFIAWYLAVKKGKQVFSWGPAGDYSYEILKASGKNEYVALDPSITLTCDLAAALAHAEVIVISISSQGLRGFIRTIRQTGDVSDKIFVLCMKGIEIESGKRLSEVLIEEGIAADRIAVWVGPGHIQDFTAGIPNCLVIDGYDPSLKKKLADDFKSSLIRFYYGTDVIGTEIGAAAKNVMGIAAGVLDGGGVSTLKGPLMTRGAREVARLIEAMGGNPLSAYGLAHLGDYETTLFSRHSHNRMYGEMLAKGQRFEKLAEGVPTAAAMKRLGKELDVDLPITEAVYDVCYGKQPKELGDGRKLCMNMIAELFSRDTKYEF